VNADAQIEAADRTTTLHVANGLAGLGDGRVDGIFDARGRGSGDFQDLGLVRAAE